MWNQSSVPTERHGRIPNAVRDALEHPRFGRAIHGKIGLASSDVVNAHAQGGGGVRQPLSRLSASQIDPVPPNLTHESGPLAVRPSRKRLGRDHFAAVLQNVGGYLRQRVQFGPKVPIVVQENRHIVIPVRLEISPSSGAEQDSALQPRPIIGPQPGDETGEDGGGRGRSERFGGAWKGSVPENVARCPGPRPHSLRSCLRNYGRMLLRGADRRLSAAAFLFPSRRGLLPIPRRAAVDPPAAAGCRLPRRGVADDGLRHRLRLFPVAQQPSNHLRRADAPQRPAACCPPPA